MSRLSKKQKRLRRLNGHSEAQQQQSNSFGLTEVTPLTPNQRRAFVQFEKDKNLLLHGYAGTGKSFVAMYLALREVETPNSPFEKVVIFRSTVQTRDMGHLPGSHKDKAKVFEAPYYDICAKLYGRGDAYDILKNKKLIEFHSTSFIRGITLDDCIIIVDESQNCTAMELHSLITRVGNNCRILFCGDIRQTDLNKAREQSGLKDFYRVIAEMECFDLIEFQIGDIVRGPLVKQYIIARTKLEDANEIRSLTQV